MDTYQFSIQIDCEKHDYSSLEDNIFEAGCDDCLLSWTNGKATLSFDRRSESLKTAVTSAVMQIEVAGYKAEVDHSIFEF